MYIVIGLGLFLLIVALVGITIAIMYYNTIRHLQKTCMNTIETLLQIRQKKSASINDNTALELITHFANAKTNENQVKALNTLIAYIQSLPSNDIGKKLKTIDTSLSTEKRFYTNTARELNGRLASFPGNFIGPMINIKEYALITLNKEESQGILPEAKYL